jgi:hypothetical protein
MHDQVQSDILRLHLARRLFRHDKRRDPKDIAELVPEYLPAIPKDPFSADGAPYAELPDYHSIGPDGIDDRMETLFDRTNPDSDRGDVFWSLEYWGVEPL